MNINEQFKLKPSETLLYIKSSSNLKDLKRGFADEHETFEDGCLDVCVSGCWQTWRSHWPKPFWSLEGHEINRRPARVKVLKTPGRPAYCFHCCWDLIGSRLQCMLHPLLARMDRSVRQSHFSLGLWLSALPVPVQCGLGLISNRVHWVHCKSPLCGCTAVQAKATATPRLYVLQGPGSFLAESEIVANSCSTQKSTMFTYSTHVAASIVGDLSGSIQDRFRASPLHPVPESTWCCSIMLRLLR